jgi:hypothetical protein
MESLRFHCNPREAECSKRADLLWSIHLPSASLGGVHGSPSRMVIEPSIANASDSRLRLI